MGVNLIIDSFRVIHGENKRWFKPEISPLLKHDRKGVVSFVTMNSKKAGLLAGSQFFITLTDEPLEFLDGKQAIFGVVEEGLDVIDKINQAICDSQDKPLRDIRIKHTVILDDPYEDPFGLVIPDASPLPSAKLLATVRIAEDEDLNGAFPAEKQENEKLIQDMQARALTLEMVGDLPFAEIKPPENVLFVCKLNPITQDEDLELIFSRFGTILSSEIVRDKGTGKSLGYAFIEYSNQEECEEAYLKMNDVLIDDRRIKVDFSQSVAKLKKHPSPGYGGSNILQRRTKYRDQGDNNNYNFVFDHDQQPTTSYVDKKRKNEYSKDLSQSYKRR